MNRGLGETDAQAAQGVTLTVLATFAGGLVIGYVLPKMFAAKSNPAHENFIGRRVELPAHIRGSRIGVVKSVHGEMLVIEVGRPYKRLVRVRKDRVTLI